MAPDKSLRAIFEAALDHEDAAGRSLYLDGACGTDAALRERIEKLLRSHEEAGGFLSRPSLKPPGSDPAPTEKAGDYIGRYRLLQQIGEGGCGVVYMAEQEEPVRRKVALKVIKLGMDTRQVIARFEAERQALALMDHPNIARVLDAGATESGRPFFVMELVKGTKITHFCDEKEFSIRERLGLFMQICSAVQHAHQKGIIHRDLKPSNILVTTVDAVAIPKVIDFGVAKATTDQRLTDKTLFTAFQQFIGTPAYMSPEQAEMSGVDVDTRSDIYSLGVVLYELLTGKPPFNSEELLRLALDEMRRTIREQEPTKPSTQFSTLAAAEGTTVAVARQSEIPSLIKVVQGDLDWIVMKCLEKDRNRRYGSANDLNADIGRFLAHEPVLARPASNLYRFRKFIARNKVTATATAAVILALILGTILSLGQAIRATRAERVERKLRQQAETNARMMLFFRNWHSGHFYEAEALGMEAISKAQQLATNDPSTLEEPLRQFMVFLLGAGRTNVAEKLFGDMLTPEVLSQPQAAGLLNLRVAFFASQSRWALAIADAVKAKKLDPANHYYYHELTALLVQVGDLKGYRENCHEALTRFRTTQDGIVAERTAKNCLILPCEGLDLDVAAQLAERAVSGDKSSSALPWFQLVKGLSEYRLKHFESAAQWMERVRVSKEQLWVLDVQAYLVLAMARHEQKQEQASRQALAQGMTIFKNKLATLQRYPVAETWIDRIFVDALAREAKSLIDGPSPTDSTKPAE